MISREEIDIVDICTPPASHESEAIEALEGGCNVVVEKPISLSVRGADNIIQASRKAGRRLFVMHNTLFNPGVRKARSWIESGKTGKIIGLEISYLNTPRTMNGWLLKKEHWVHKLPGGVITEGLPHPVYLSQYFLGKVKVVTVSARKLSGLEWVVVDDVRALLQSGDVQAMVHMSYNFPRGARTMSVVGEKAEIYVDLETGFAELSGPSRDGPLGLGIDYVRESARMLGLVVKESIHRSASGHYTLLANTVDCLLNDTPPLVSMEVARDVVRVCEDIYSRYDNGQFDHSIADNR
jgi:predicted dehydrogenase